MLGQASCMGLYKTDKYGPIWGVAHAPRQVSAISKSLTQTCGYKHTQTHTQKTHAITDMYRFSSENQGPSSLLDIHQGTATLDQSQVLHHSFSVLMLRAKQRPNPFPAFCTWQ